MKIEKIIYILFVLACTTGHAEVSDFERMKALMDDAKNEQRLGNHKSAIRAYKKVYAKSPALKNEALQGLVNSYVQAKKFDAAEEVLKEETEKNPFMGEYRIWLSEVYIAAEKYPMALDEITSAEKILGSNKVVLRIKADSQRKLNRHADAIATLTAFLKLEPKDYMALIDRADSNFVLNQYEQAFTDAQAAYEARNFDERVVSFYTKAAFFHNNYAEVKKIGKRCIELFSKNESCFEFLGRASFQTKEYPAAIKFFESALNLNSTQQEARLLYAEALALNGNEQESDTQFAEVLKRYPNYEMAMKSWAKFLTQRKKVEALGVALRKYCDNNPGSVWASVELSKLLFLVGDQETGLDRMDTVTSENKSDLGKFFFAYFLDASGKHKKARNNLESIKDKSLDVDFHMGIAFAKDKRFQDAIKHWSKIKVDSPNYFKSQINIALANEQMGQVVKAKEMLTTLSVAVPSEYKVALEQKINSMGSEDRKPANDNQRGISFFLDWSLPQI